MSAYVVRTIRYGRVKINGEYFYPDHRRMKYDGRLDGRRYVFIPYSESVVEMWGAERELHESVPMESCPETVDGMHPWCSWYSESALARLS